MLTGTSNDIGSLELEDQIGRCDRAVIRMRLSLQGLVASDEFGKNISGMDKSGPLDLGLQNRWEVERGCNLVDRRWEALKSNPLAMTDLVSPLHMTVKEGATIIAEESKHGSQEAETQGFHEALGNGITEEHGREQGNVSRPTAVPNRLRGADCWGR